jgi:hypothetical protein
MPTSPMNTKPVLAPGIAPGKSWIRRMARRAGIVIATVAALVLGVSVVVRIATTGPEEAVHGFLTAAGNGNYSAAYDYFSAPLKQEQSLAEFSAQAQANSLFLQVKDTTFNNRSIETGSGAKLAGSVTLETGTEVPAMFRLVKENGKWKLIGYRIGS